MDAHLARAPEMISHVLRAHTLYTRTHDEPYVSWESILWV
jgi:hypothetical protein